jgi:hypothetical protein
MQVLWFGGEHRILVLFETDDGESRLIAVASESSPAAQILNEVICCRGSGGTPSNGYDFCGISHIENCQAFALLLLQIENCPGKPNSR